MVRSLPQILSNVFIAVGATTLLLVAIDIAFRTRRARKIKRYSRIMEVCRVYLDSEHDYQMEIYNSILAVMEGGQDFLRVGRIKLGRSDCLLFAQMMCVVLEKLMREFEDAIQDATDDRECRDATDDSECRG